MRRISGYFFSLLLVLQAGSLFAQDTVLFPLKIRAGFDIAGPGIYLSDRNNLNLEGFFSFDKSEKMAFVMEAGYLNYKYSQYNYDYTSKGAFARLGVDFNLLKPEVSLGKYWAGIGLRYGVSLFNSETPSFEYENYWGTVVSSIPPKKAMGHFIEVAPGVKTEIFRNFSMGWTIRLKLLITGGGGKDLRPIYFPGYGNGGRKTTAGISYFLTWNIPYKTKTVITKPEDVEEETEETSGQNAGAFF
ncbi:MAG: hypothetical protein E4H43_00745 [Bacteroidia bacterium]|nr:MAG: hypothetical protein E4H43_00745 [Bacteroidia bacterium]